MLVDKENNANHVNITVRRKRRQRTQDRPLTSILETTFSPLQLPLPNVNRISIPALLNNSKHSLLKQDPSLQPEETLSHRFPRSNKGPVIAKSHKLRSFFGQEEERYPPKRKMSLNPGLLVRRSHDSISERHVSSRISKISQTLEMPITQVNTSRKHEFARLYQKQKTHYERLLQRHGISEAVEDDEYLTFMLR